MICLKGNLVEKLQSISWKKCINGDIFDGCFLPLGVRRGVLVAFGRRSRKLRSPVTCHFFLLIGFNSINPGSASTLPALLKPLASTSTSFANAWSTLFQFCTFPTWHIYMKIKRGLLLLDLSTTLKVTMRLYQSLSLIWATLCNLSMAIIIVIMEITRKAWIRNHEY